MIGEEGEPADRQRRHTLFFLEVIRDFAPVFLDTEVDMSAVLAHRARTVADGGARYSTTTYVLRAVGRVLAEHPDANAAIQDGPDGPRIARYPVVHGKLALDRVLDGRRVVLGAVIPDVDAAELPEIQEHLNRVRDAEVTSAPEFEGVRALHKLPWAEGREAFRAAAESLAGRPRLTGTFAVTSLGHRAVDGFHSVGGTTTTFGVGRVVDRPVARAGTVAIAPILRLSLTFDHRVIDGAEAADVLTEVKEQLESV